MDYFEITWVVSGIILFSLITYLNYKLVKKFEENEELTMTKIYLDDRGAKAFKIFAIGISIYGLSMFVGGSTVTLSDYIYHYASKIGSGIMFVTWLYFMYTLVEISEAKTS